MPALSRGQENTTSIINWWITVNGVRTDAYEIGFRILDITGGLPGTQIFPSVDGEYEDVTDAPGKFGVGSYYAYDNANTRGWTPEVTTSVGTHRVEWRWKISSEAPYQAGQEDVEILVQSGGSSTDTYISVDDVREAGVPEEVDGGPSDAEVLSQIEIWQAFLDRACRQWFVPKAATFSFDGNDSNLIGFGVPIISISYLKINSCASELDTDFYKVYNGVTYPDDRKNPRIKLVHGSNRDIYRGVYEQQLKFRKGVQNQEVSGTFGYLEADGTTPKMIKRALLKLVIEKMLNPVVPGTLSASMPSPPPIMASIVEEWTDGHKMKYGTSFSTNKSGISGITRDQEILDIIKLYRAPLGIATASAGQHG